MDILRTLLIGLISGWIAGNILSGSGYGVIGDILVGMIGSFVGSYIFKALGLSAYGILGQIILSVVGAIAFVLFLRLLKRA